MTFDVQADQYVTWLVDHPVLLNERLIMHRDMDNLWIGCVYQTHVAYLKQCMDSIVNQTLKDIEIICVDDGSTDASLSSLIYGCQKI